MRGEAYCGESSYAEAGFGDVVPSVDFTHRLCRLLV